MHGATFLDAAGRPLRPAILWNDGRAFAECEELERRVPDLRRRAGNIAMPGFTAPKALWVAKHEPAVFAATQRILLPKDYVRLRLTGEAVSEMSDASGTLWLDVGKRAWDDELLAATGLKRAHMPEVSSKARRSPPICRPRLTPPGVSPGGAFRSPAERATTPPRRSGSGRSRLAPASSRSAHRASSFRSPTFVLFTRTAHAFCHALPGAGGAATMLSAAAALSWIASALGRGEDVGGCVAEAEAFAKSAKAVETAPIFLPYLSGERTPHNDAAATGLFAGLRAEHGSPALIYAVLEGVAFAFADGVDVLSEAGARPKVSMLVGGGARSSLWGQMIADATGLTIDLAAGAEAGAALGAARLAMLAAGAGDVACPPAQRQFAPDAAPPIARACVASVRSMARKRRRAEADREVFSAAV